MGDLSNWNGYYRELVPYFWSIVTGKQKEENKKKKKTESINNHLNIIQ